MSSSSSSSEVRVRFAPSPTGQLHIGGYRTALYNYLFAKKHGGTFILRLEDTDQERLVLGAAEIMEETLKWAKIVPDESPHLGGPRGPYTQSQRLDLYHEAVNQMLDRDVAYRCFCTERRLDLLRREAARNKTQNKYDGRCRALTKEQVEAKLAEGLPYTVRFKLDPSNAGVFEDMIFGKTQFNVYEMEGDPIILKSDGFPTYHLANVVDDHHMEVSHVLRGMEWQVSTPKHIMMYQAMGWRPPRFGHLPLILNPDGTKLSKRQGDVHLEHYRDRGYLPEAIMNFVTLTGGGFQKLMANQGEDDLKLWTLSDLTDGFDIDGLRTSSSQMDFERLGQLNRKAVQETLARDPDSLVKDVRKLLREKFNNNVIDISDEDLLDHLKWASERITHLDELVNKIDFTFLWQAPSNLSYEGPVGGSLLKAVIQTLRDDCDSGIEFAATNKTLKKLAKDEKVPYSKLMQCLRILICGEVEGPPIKEMLERLGPTETIARLENGLHCLAKNKT